MIKDTDNIFYSVKEKSFSGKRISPDEALWLFNNADIADLGVIAWNKCNTFHNGLVCFNKNVHLEPTNICVFRCRFCSFSRDSGHIESWDLSHEEIDRRVKEAASAGATEIHIVGGVHPDRDINYYASLIEHIRYIAPSLHIKAFTAIEINYMSKLTGISVQEGLAILKKSGLGSLPGGGAEIFSDKIRNKICPEKGDMSVWLKVHESAHMEGIPSNATMLYGHIETPEDIVHHLTQIRDLQDRTKGFNCFIPLKYRNYNNLLSDVDEKPWLYDMRIFALSRIFLDNIPNIKAYWPMLGKKLASLLLSFGANDLDGTINDSTKIYSMAGAEEKNPSMTAVEICELIRKEGFEPFERDSLYNHI